MQLGKDKSVLADFNEAIQHEWIETNGLGGWAGTSIIGCNTRRYHGLLVAATKPPAERMSLVSKMDETIVTESGRIELGVNLYRGDIVHPKGNQYLETFTRDLFPEWIYEAGGIRLMKTISMLHGKNTTLVLYEVLEAPSTFVMELQPFLSVRGYHNLMQANDAIQQKINFSDGLLTMKAYEGTPEIFISVPESNFISNPSWYFHFNYAIEKYRGLDYEEDLFTPGHFSVELNKGDYLGILLSTEQPTEADPRCLLAGESLRKQMLLNEEPEDDTLQQLVLAADQFIVKRGDDLKTVIAGYHWFTDWGRDTMISLPGLCLGTGRFDDARRIISAFAQSISMGMLPNRFQDNEEPPEYNNVDGTLWYFIAVYKYLLASGDRDFVINEILPVLKDIVDWHFRGTRYNIHADEDGLLFAGEKGQQLTWMDARIANWVVTPRMGKPVEIQALWYNTLRIFAELLRMNNQLKDADLVDDSADKAKQSFLSKFWYSGGNYLYDVIDEENRPDPVLRPNQLFAISLPFPLIEGEHARLVLEKVEEKLYTPVGLKSLTPDDPHYVGFYGGDAFHRDASYHEGTVWTWLLGPFIESVIKVRGEAGLSKALQLVNNFAYHLNEGGIGTVSEILDAEGTHHPRGCIAQAWGVAEILRVIKEYHLFQQKSKSSKRTMAGGMLS